MVIFAMNLSYGFISNPCYFMVFEYRSYHIIADSIHPYKYFIRLRYSTFTPFSKCTFFLCLGFTSHIMSTNSHSIFNWTNLSSGMSALMYSPGTSKISTNIPSCALMMRMVNKASREIVGKDASSLVM